MTIYDYHLLSKQDQAFAVQCNGIGVDSRIHPHNPDVIILLIQLPAFYVEVFFDNKKYDVIRISPFTSLYRLEPYLQAINIEEIKRVLHYRY